MIESNAHLCPASEQFMGLSRYLSYTASLVWVATKADSTPAKIFFIRK